MDKRYMMLLEALACTPRDVRRLLRPVTAEQAAFRPTGRQSMLDILNTFIGIEAAARAQFERVLAEDHAELPPLTARPETHELLFAAIDAVENERGQTTLLLAGLTQQQWLRTAMLHGYGPLRLRTLVERLVARDSEQLALLVDLR